MWAIAKLPVSYLRIIIVFYFHMNGFALGLASKKKAKSNSGYSTNIKPTIHVFYQKNAFLAKKCDVEL